LIWGPSGSSADGFRSQEELLANAAGDLFLTGSDLQARGEDALTETLRKPGRSGGTPADIQSSVPRGSDAVAENGDLVVIAAAGTSPTRG
jgi:hypothetical protein